MKSRDVFAVFNRGRISRKALARTDVSRIALSAETQTNWMPQTLGPMSLRPGFGYLGTITGNGADIPFIYSRDDTAILELSASALRIWDQGTTLVTRASVTSSVTNGTFTTDLTGWTDDDDAGSTSTWNTGLGAGVLRLEGTKYGSARRYQEITVGGNAGTEHALRIEIARGPVLLRVGTTAGDDDVFRQAVLRTGTHSIAFTPAGNFFIEFSSSLEYPVWVDSVSIEPSGTLSLPTPWTSTAICKSVRWQQSGDVVFCGATGIQQRRIERRDNNSWSVVVYEPTGGPYQTENTDPTRLTPSAISGFLTLTSDKPVFRSGHVGALFRLTSQGQVVEADTSAEATFTNSIRVTGVTSGRIFNIVIAGTWTGTVSLQRSVGEVGSWVTVATYTSNTTTTYDDGLDNSEVYYRLGVETGNYGSGTAECALSIDTGSITGDVRVTNFISSTEVSAIALSPLGGTDATEIWAEGSWSEINGWPDAPAIWDGRLWWSGGGRNYGSASDAFASFNPDIEGDSAPINREVGETGASTTNWLLPLTHLIAGTGAAEYSVRSTSFDEPVTPSNYNVKARSTKGSASVPAVVADDRGYFVGRDNRTLYELKYSPEIYGYSAVKATVLCPEIGEGDFVRIAVQQQPELRVFCVRGDGTAAVLLVNEVEDVKAWVDIETEGNIEDVVVLPGDEEDRVFFRVRRNINGVNVRYRERLALESECVGGTANLQADSYITGGGGVVAPHLANEDVVVWADGEYQGTDTLNGSGVSSLGPFDSWVIGLPYEATYKSAKLAGQTALGLDLAQRKRINSLGLILTDTHHDGLYFGPNPLFLDPLPQVLNEEAVPDGTIHDYWDDGMVEFPGEWNPDSRLHLKAYAPKPCTILGAVINVDRNDAP